MYACNDRLRSREEGIVQLDFLQERRFRDCLKVFVRCTNEFLVVFMIIRDHQQVFLGVPNVSKFPFAKLWTPFDAVTLSPVRKSFEAVNWGLSVFLNKLIARRAVFLDEG